MEDRRVLKPFFDLENTLLPQMVKEVFASGHLSIPMRPKFLEFSFWVEINVGTLYYYI